MVVYSRHIHIAHLVDGFLADPIHIITQTDKRRYTNQKKQNKTTYQKLCSAVSFFVFLVRIFFIIMIVHKYYPSQIDYFLKKLYQNFYCKTIFLHIFDKI